MSGSAGLGAERGTECNRVNVGGTTTLLGDPEVRPEKPYTIITFPGGSVEIARCEDGRYWIHAAVRGDDAEGRAPGRIVDARMDFDGRYEDEGNAALRRAVEAGDCNHVAFLVEPGARR